MWTENTIYREDLELVAQSNSIRWEKLRNKSVLVTGAAGLIGSLTVNAMIYYSIQNSMPVTIYALVRDLERAELQFAPQLAAHKGLKLIQGDVRELPVISEKIDYIIHAAAPTSSHFFSTHPMETMDIIFNGTKNVLDCGRTHRVCGLVFLSTMEVYGTPESDAKILESASSNLNLESARSGYPEAKRAAETLCSAYRTEYGMPTKVLRLTQTFGAGVNSDDQRIFAQIARCAITHDEMVLSTRGETKRCYLYTADAVAAILTVLLQDTPFIMNAANESSYCSILEMAQIAGKEFNFPVKIDLSQNPSSFGYAPVLKMNLDTSKLLQTGWKPNISLMDMYRRMITAMLSERQVDPNG